MIGFSGGIPENKDRTWTKEINGQMYIFEKRRDKEAGFLYKCSANDTHAGIKMSFDLTPEEVEEKFDYLTRK